MNLYENLSTAMFCDLIDKNYLKKNISLHILRNKKLDEGH